MSTDLTLEEIALFLLSKTSLRQLTFTIRNSVLRQIYLSLKKTHFLG